MIPAIIDQRLYCQREDKNFVGINGSYVDGIRRAGANEWLTHSDAILELFMIAGNR